MTQSFRLSQGGAGIDRAQRLRFQLDGKRRAWDALERLLLRAEPDRTVLSESAAPFLDRRFVLARLPEPAGDGAFYRLDGVERGSLGAGRRPSGGCDCGTAVSSRPTS